MSFSPNGPHASNEFVPNNLVWAAAMDMLMAWVLPLAAKRKYVFVEHVRIFLNSTSGSWSLQLQFDRLACLS